MRHSGAPGRHAILGAVRAAGSARCARSVAWRGTRPVVTTRGSQPIGSRRELLDAQGGCGLRGECFLVLVYLIQIYLNFLDPRGPAPVFSCLLALFFSSFAGDGIFVP